MPDGLKRKNVLRTGCIVVAVALVAWLGGCQAPRGTTEVARGGRVFPTVDFAQGQTLRYRFVSSREITVDWDPNAAPSKGRLQELSERLETVVAYTPVEVDPYGVSTIRAAVESVKATRSSGPGARTFGPDAAEAAQGKTFELKVDPRGKIVEAAPLEALIRELGEKAFRADTSRGRIKEPDLIADFVAGQWFLWDAVAKIEQPAEGVAVGQTWPSQLSVPTPMVMRRARNVTYRLAEVRPSAGGPLAMIASAYTLAEAPPAGWPVAYSGRFQMAGTFGFLGPYEVLGLAGGGTEQFNLKTGRTERQQQKYTLRMKASLPPLGIQANPLITIEQTLTMELQ
jgi:hypothetical protein